MLLPIFLILIISLALGVGIYLFFYNKENQFFPQDKFKKDWNSFLDRKPKIQSQWNISAFFLFLSTFGFAIIVNSIVFSSHTKLLDLGAFVLALAFWPFFPYGLILIFEPLEEIGALLMCGAYPASIFLSLYIKNKRYLTFVYLIFLFLLVLNIIGCSEITPNDIMEDIQMIGR